MLEFHRAVDVICNSHEGLGAFAVRILFKPVDSKILVLLKAELHRNLSQKRNVHLLAKFLSAVFSEHSDMLAAVRADEIAHVLDDSDNICIELAGEVDALFGIKDRHLLGCGDEDTSAEIRNALADCKLLVSGSRR